MKITSVALLALFPFSSASLFRAAPVPKSTTTKAQVIVHGHRNLLQGQRIMLRKGIINFECDTTMDRGSRKKESLPGTGASVTIFKREGIVVGVSSDYPKIKVFDPFSPKCVPCLPCDTDKN